MRQHKSRNKNVPTLWASYSTSSNLSKKIINVLCQDIAMRMFITTLLIIRKKLETWNWCPIIVLMNYDTWIIEFCRHLSSWCKIMVFKQFSMESSGVRFGVLGFLYLMGIFLLYILDFHVRFNLSQEFIVQNCLKTTLKEEHLGSCQISFACPPRSTLWP